MKFYLSYKCIIKSLLCFRQIIFARKDYTNYTEISKGGMICIRKQEKTEQGTRRNG